MQGYAQWAVRGTSTMRAAASVAGDQLKPPPCWLPRAGKISRAKEPAQAAPKASPHRANVPVQLGLKGGSTGGQQKSRGWHLAPARLRRGAGCKDAAQASPDHEGLTEACRGAFCHLIASKS